MAMNKAIESGKEHRKPYIGGKAIDKNCRNHGSCMWCYMNRIHKSYKREIEAKDKMKEWEAYI